MTQEWDETPERDMTEKDYSDEQQQSHGNIPSWESQCQCENCGFLNKEPAEWGFDPYCHGFGNHVQGAKIPLDVWLWIKRYGCASHTSAVTLTPLLTEHYAALSAQQGKPVSELVARDLEEYQEYRRWLVNKAERL